MSRKGKVDPVLKVKAVEEVIASRAGIVAEARKVGVSEGTIQAWIASYKADGPTGLQDHKRNKVYSRETKLMAVNDYLSGKGSLIEVASKYKLRNKSQLLRWVKTYNTQLYSQPSLETAVHKGKRSFHHSKRFSISD